MGCYSGSCRSRWLRYIVSAIAIIDLSIVALPLTYETVTLGYILGLLDPFGHLQRDCTQNKNNCTQFNSDFDGNYSFQLSTYSVTTLILFMLMGAVVEGYLFAMLRRGVRDEVHHWCKRWFWMRFFLLLFVSLGSAWKIYRNHYTILVDGLFDLVKLYRAIALIFVRFYMCELEYTVGVTYVPPPVRPKKGSLGQDIHLLT